jgi:hypothetical protein
MRVPSVMAIVTTCTIIVGCGRTGSGQAAPHPTIPTAPDTTTDRDSNGRYTEERKFCSDPPVQTPELNNVTCPNLPPNPECTCLGRGEYCYKKTRLNVFVPNERWVFIDSPHVECMQDNQGSCAWNVLGAPDRFFVTVNNPDHKQADVLTSSRSIRISLCATARFYP